MLLSLAIIINNLQASRILALFFFSFHFCPLRYAYAIKIKVVKVFFHAFSATLFIHHAEALMLKSSCPSVTGCSISGLAEIYNNNLADTTVNSQDINNSWND